ncbi:hypothetical protein MPSEU_000936000 [Mayamaea pseudoterrestris]|nr:hypothetical protein MPSEU_000936000 [Mayamaea pseudoterrestris]
MARPSRQPRSLIEVIVSTDNDVRNSSLSHYCALVSTNCLLEQCVELDEFRRTSTINLYERVRACFFLYAIHRFHLVDIPDSGEIPYSGYKCLQNRQFEQAIENFLNIHNQRPSKSISSALAKAYYHLGFQLLANQVRLSVKNHPGNSWMFQFQLVQDHPYNFHPDLLQANCNGGSKRFLQESTPVRMDLSHCGWSDIFFLGMDYPEGARVLNASIDLSVYVNHQRNNGDAKAANDSNQPKPPIDTILQVISEPVLRLTSIDLKCEVTLTLISEVFDFAKDYLGLLRAGIIASGIVPLGLEDSKAPLSALFDKTIGLGKGVHLITHVNDIPKGSRLAVSTNLLASIIAVGMRATGQTQQLTGPLTEDERRLVAARAILGEWLGGSGGGWQDSGGLWPGLKLIEGVRAEENDPEHGTSRGRLLPMHRQLSDIEAPSTLLEALQNHLVLVHGGMAQNVGPVLEMVTEKYLLRESDEWRARNEALLILDDILKACKDNDVTRLAKLTTRNFFEPVQTIIPWASNVYTETIISRTREDFGDDFLGFWMLGGCSGGGMGFIFKPSARQRALVRLHEIILHAKRELEHALPFAMDPCVYNFSINQHGTVAQLHDGAPPSWIKNGSTSPASEESVSNGALETLLNAIGFDREQHETVRALYQNRKIGLRQNRLPVSTEMKDVLHKDIVTTSCISPALHERGVALIQNGAVAVVTLAAGLGTRWTQGAGCVKAIHPFCKLNGKHRTFLEIHIAKSRCISEFAGATLPMPHIITTSFLTDKPIKEYLHRFQCHAYAGPLIVSCGTAVGIRLIPTVSDLNFKHEQEAVLDKQAQKVKESCNRAAKCWAESCGPASDYRENLPSQCLHPVGHFWEVPNLLTNGTLPRLLDEHPQLQYLMLHNIDTVGADVDPAILGLFADRGSAFAFEVIPRQIQDVGGGLARVNGRTRLVEGLAWPREEDEFKFSYYNSMTTWIDIDKMLYTFKLDRDDLSDASKVSHAVHSFSLRLPTYVALKDVKRRWGNGHEDVLPTAQFEQLWSDITSLDDVDCDFFLVPRTRGGQLKDVAQLDGWLRDGSAKHLESICAWPDSE